MKLDRRSFLKRSLATTFAAVFCNQFASSFDPDEFEVRVYATMREYLSCDLRFIKEGVESYPGQKLVTLKYIPRIKAAVQRAYDYCKEAFGWQFVVWAGQNA